MEDQTRNIYPGGNTPKGFYSYYNYILPQRKAEKIFCIKGGPGVGKSTLMKSVAAHFAEKGEAMDLLWCSSDPDSLDGVLLKERAVAIVDGTSPHIVDPKNPGAIDEIINLGEFWDEEKIKEQRNRIIACNERISTAFTTAYGYLKCAEPQYEFLKQVLDKLVTPQEKLELKRRIDTKIESISAVKRAENKVVRDMVMGNNFKIGETKKAFAGAITPKGLKNEIFSIVNGVERVIAIETPVGFRIEKLLSRVSERLVAAGLDVEEYYCPMKPEKGLEHILCPEASLAVITCNSFHNMPGLLSGKKNMKIKVGGEIDGEKEYRQIAEELRNGISMNISKALEVLKKAKMYHDELETYYIPHMDFAEIERVKDKIIEKIEHIVVK